ncbi:MAG: putative glycoside hydrolase [Clostridiales bacterium]|nr:putative glycoside hydrolase [Clostridiales bacterium]
MDVYMQRHTMPKNYSYAQETSGGTINEVVLNLHALYTESVSLDGSVILDSVITELSQGGYNSAAFDIKRADGSVGYKSSLASVDSYGATAFPASDLKTSVQKLNEQDILAVGRVYCYLDNLVPEQDNSAAVLNKDGVPYTDSKGNTYLNPDSETTYRYIKDIISEAMEMGVTVFVLDGINLPENISDNYNDGFEYISGKLYSDLGTDIKLLEAVDINFNSASADNAGNTGANDSQADTQLSNQIQNEISNQLTIDTGSDKIYYITSDYDKSLIKKNLEAGGISSYILAN